MGTGASDIAEVVSEIREKLPDLQPQGTTLEPESARFRLFDSITTFLKNKSSSDGLVLVLDNLHWADGSSLRLLEFVAQELADTRMLIVGTYRDVEVSRGHPLYRTLGELTSQRLFHRILLRGLDQHEVGRVLEVTGGLKRSTELITQVHQQTEGNPLFVGEVGRLLAQEGIPATGDVGEWDFRLPEGVREVIGRRLDRLSDECNQLLTVASVVGREFDFRLLKALSADTDESRLLELLDEALEARVIEENAGRGERYQFSHSLIQRTLAEELSTSRRVRLHARIGEALEELYGNDAD